METEVMCIHVTFFFSFSFSSVLILISHHHSLLVPFSRLLHLFLFILIWRSDPFRSMFCILSTLFSGLSCQLSLPPALSLHLSLRSQWVWLRAECRVPPLSLAIKAMPTPRLHMSSRPSKRGGVVLIRSVSCSSNTPRHTSIHLSLHDPADTVCLRHSLKISILASLWFYIYRQLYF